MYCITSTEGPLISRQFVIPDFSVLVKNATVSCFPQIIFPRLTMRSNTEC